MIHHFPGAVVECYAGYKGEETPRAILIDGRRRMVVDILSRKRALDRASGRIRDIWRCRLDDGRRVTVELLDTGAWRVSAPS
jgi:hypothetical protein